MSTPAGAIISDTSLTLLVGTTDNTTVTIKPTQNVVIPEDSQDPNSLYIQLEAGSSHVITLHRLQTFLFEAYFVDLTGSKIVSDKPLTVMSGHQCPYVPYNVLYCEAISVNVPPTTACGTEFLLTPHGGRTGGQYYKFVVAEANTAITNNCNGNLVTNVLEYAYEGSSFNFSTPSEAYCYAKSDKPVFIVILSVGSTLNDGNIGDPVMSIVPPIDHYTTSNILQTIVTSILTTLTLYPLNQIQKS